MKILVHDKMQTNYVYLLSAPYGKVHNEEFNPYFSPQEMLELGVFEGKYCNDCQEEYPSKWFENAKISDNPNVECNYFKIKSRQPLSIWKEKGWINEHDPRGWFQWYCRYWLGRRIEGYDDWQIKRWRAFSRHAGAIRKNCIPNDANCRPKQRQALLQWSHNPFI